MAFFITASWEAVPAACPPASPSIPEAGPHPSSWDLPPRAGAADAGAGPPSVLLPGRTWGRSRLRAASPGANSLTSTLPVAASLQRLRAEGLRGALNGREGAFLISFSSISAVPQSIYHTICVTLISGCFKTAFIKIKSGDSFRVSQEL